MRNFSPFAAIIALSLSGFWVSPAAAGLIYEFTAAGNGSPVDGTKIATMELSQLPADALLGHVMAFNFTVGGDAYYTNLGFAVGTGDYSGSVAAASRFGGETIVDDLAMGLRGSDQSFGPGIPDI